ncbi:glycosyl hydrolases family 18-domain-containing protein [Choanephora cucurbitarum]|nr:glycosyl hydrolases family 18-domain-containing protein [Choanephora cucurbitarum]
MKINALLISVIATAYFYLLDGITASPLRLQARADRSNKVIVGYFPNWLYGRYLPSKIDFKRYTHINYAFAIQNSGGNPIWQDTGVFDDYVQYGFPKLISLAHQAGTKVLISVGGWSGSTGFSTMAASASSRKSFVQWNIDFVKKFNTDGVDIDWEYPNSVGAGCNAVSDQDVDNFNLLVKELREALDSNFPNSHKEISIAVHITPWGGATKSDDVSGFVPYVDRFHVMAFDVNGAWNSTSGPNAPFRAEPGKGYSVGFAQGIEAWNAAGVPYNKLVGGIPFYGRAQTLTVSSNPTTQYNPAVSPNPPLGDSLDGPWTNPYCSKDSSQASGVWRWANMRSSGLLSSPTTAASPWIRHFDDITQTPWLYNPTNKQFISYDDPISLGVKTKYALDKGLAGLFVWSIEQDNGELLDAISPMIGGNSPPSAITSGAPSATNTPSQTSTQSATASVPPTSSSTATNGSPTGAAGCDSASTWSSGTVYTSGSLATYQGKLYKAQWWTQGETPSANGSSWSVWSLVKTC